MKNNTYVCHTPYLRNSTAYDHDFLGCQGGKKGKKLSKMKNNNNIQHAPYLRNIVAYVRDF